MKRIGPGKERQSLIYEQRFTHLIKAWQWIARFLNHQKIGNGYQVVWRTGIVFAWIGIRRSDLTKRLSYRPKEIKRRRSARSNMSGGNVLLCVGVSALQETALDNKALLAGKE